MNCLAAWSDLTLRHCMPLCLAQLHALCIYTMVWLCVSDALPDIILTLTYIHFPLLGGCYVYCVLINVLNHLHRCEECYIQL